MPDPDVIIVGAGSAGCVLAARLSEDHSRSVLLIEGGPDYPDEASLPSEIRSSHMPAFSHDWEYHSEPVALDRRVHLARGRLVGGCSSTNATFAVRGNPQDYDEWARRGNEGWSFSDVLPSFRKLERDADFDDEWHGRDGPLPIRRYQKGELTSVHRAFLESCGDAGFDAVADHNHAGATGAGPAPMNAIDGVRQSTALTYLSRARERPNFSLRSDALVDRVVIDGKAALGVRLASGESLRSDRVILAGGSYSSPAILMRSGIGPADELRSLGIAPVIDLPGVGRTLADHPLVGLTFSAASEVLDGTVPFVQTLLTAKSAAGHETFDLHIFPATIAPEEPGAPMTMILFVGLMKPASRGTLRLRSADPGDAPIIDLGYFSHASDLPRMIEGARIARRLSRTRPLADLLIEEQYPGPDVSDDTAGLERAVLDRVETYHHPAGTCRMGPPSDGGAVVDARGNVHGVEGLSVIDASIMPEIPAANTNVPTIMVAERCAAWFRQDS